MSGYRVLDSAEAMGHRVDIVAWNDEPASLIAVQSGYDAEVVQFEVQDLGLMIVLLQQAKALLEAATEDSGAAASSPAAAAPVTTTPAENR